VSVSVYQLPFISVFSFSLRLKRRGFPSVAAVGIISTAMREFPIRQMLQEGFHESLRRFW